MNDCVFNHGKKCEALTEKNCEGCCFRKTRAELAKGRAKASERIESLPPEEQKHILLKYYARGRTNKEC